MDINLNVMSLIARNREGDSLPLLSINTLKYQTIDGSGGSALSSPLEPGKYRIVISESSGNDAFINITTNGAAAEVEKGAYMPLGVVEYIFIDVVSIIAVINGKLNITEAY
jgi:hypothetical protein